MSGGGFGPLPPVNKPPPPSTCISRFGVAGGDLSGQLESFNRRTRAVTRAALLHLQLEFGADVADEESSNILDRFVDEVVDAAVATMTSFG